MVSMSTPQQPRSMKGLDLEFPQSLAVYAEYKDAQKAVDFLSDREFPVQNCMIVGTELKQVERITGRLTNAKVAGLGALSGAWLVMFVGLIFSFFGKNANVLGLMLSTALLGAAFGSIWALVGFLATRGQRDFSSVTAVVATRYEVLVEHKHLQAAQELLRQLPGALPNPFA
jgi:hypothetical protein